MILLVDIGNSRVKWATFDGQAVGPQQAAEHERWSAHEWQAALFADVGISRVVAATVAGEASALQLREAARRAHGCEVEFVATERAAAGVRNAYPDPRLLGVDRWLAVIAAHHRTHRACCIVDVGTAATIDAVTAEGQHLGGFIVPGPRLMIASLLQGTSNLEDHTAASRSSAGSLFADNTRDAIERGCLLALAALAERAAQELERRVGARPVLLFTGGAAPLVAPLVLAAAELVPDLVLRGLAVLAMTQP